jgi:hypothetical protein
MKANEAFSVRGMIEVGSPSMKSMRENICSLKSLKENLFLASRRNVKLNIAAIQSNVKNENEPQYSEPDQKIYK